MRLAFYLSDTESIEWTSDRQPEIGEELVFVDRGVYRVVGPHVSRLPESYDGEYKIERVRAATHDDLAKALNRGPGALPAL